MDQTPATPSIVAEDKKRAARGGWRSTKLHLALITMGVLTGGFLLLVSQLTEGASGDALFGTYVMGMLGAAGIYSGSNVAATLSARGSASSKDD